MSATADTRSLRLAIILVCAIALAMVGPARIEPAGAVPVVRTWTGAGANNSWTTAANWDSGAPVAGDRLYFPIAAARKANSNNFANFTSFESITFEGSGYTISGNRVVVTDEVFHIATGTNTISLIIDGTADIRQAGGTLNLMGANSHAGSNIITAGTLHAGHNNAFGEFDSLVDLFQGTVSVAGGITIFNPLIIGGPAVPTLQGFGNAEWIGTIDVADDSSFDAGPGATFELSGPIAGVSGFVKTGPGTLILSEVNTFAGLIEVQQGTLRVTRQEAFGSSAQGTRVLAGATLALAGTHALTEPIEIAGGGFASLGALRSMQDIVLVGNLTAAGDATIRVDAGILRLTNGLDHEPGANVITKTGGGMLEIEGHGTFSEQIVVAVGELSVRGTLDADVRVDGGVLSGDGSVGRLDLFGGRLEPGVFGGETLKVNGVAYLGPLGTASFTVTSPNDYSQLWVSGTLILDGGSLEVLGPGTIPPGAEVTLIRHDSAAPVNGIFNGRQEGDVVVVGGNQFRLTYEGGQAPGNDVVLKSLEGLAPFETEVQIVDGTPTAPSGGEFEARYVAFNVGDGPVTNAEVRIPVHAGAVFKSYQADPGWTCVAPPVGQTGNLICANPSWEPTGAVEFALFIVVMTIVGNEGDSLLVQIFLEHDGIEADLSDNVDSRVVPIGSSDPRPFKLRLPGVARDGSN